MNFCCSRNSAYANVTLLRRFKRERITKMLFAETKHKTDIDFVSYFSNIDELEN